MAIIKEIELENGVKVNYHRVVSINKVTNNQNIIEIASYTNKEKRKEEVEKIGQETNIFIHTTYLNTPYDEKININNVYEYLKTLEQFKNAVDDK